MLSVSDMFYGEKEEPVLLVAGDRSRSQTRKGSLSRQDSRNFRSSASPPPSRSNHHASSWFGHRKSSQSPPRSRHQAHESSPPRSRHQAYESGYSDYRNSKNDGRSPEGLSRSSGSGRKSSDSHSPPASSRHHNSRQHTRYKEDYTGYAPAEYRYEGSGNPTYEYRYADGSGNPIYGRDSPGHKTGSPYVSSDMYRGQHPPGNYRNAYGSPNFSGAYAETVELKVPLCCEACEERITNHMLALEGVESVTCDQKKQKVTVRGVASPAEILQQGRECFKQTRFWTDY